MQFRICRSGRPSFRHSRNHPKFAHTLHKCSCPFESCSNHFLGSSWRKFIVVISDFPINFASHSFLASLFSSQGPGRAGAPRCRALVCACRTPYSRFRLLRRLGCLYTIQVLACFRSPLVGSNGLEPSTSRLSGVRSNHLSYEPISVAGSFPIGQTCCLRFAFASVRDRRLPFRSDRNAT